MEKVSWEENIRKGKVLSKIGERKINTAITKQKENCLGHGFKKKYQLKTFKKMVKGKRKVD